jgi:hypothetical protein
VSQVAVIGAEPAADARMSLLAIDGAAAVVVTRARSVTAIQGLSADAGDEVLKF